jgi:hypothetical protein
LETLELELEPGMVVEDGVSRMAWPVLGFGLRVEVRSMEWMRWEI